MAGDYEYFAAQAIPYACILACILQKHVQCVPHAYLAAVQWYHNFPHLLHPTRCFYTDVHVTIQSILHCLSHCLTLTVHIVHRLSLTFRVITPLHMP